MENLKLENILDVLLGICFILFHNKIGNLTITINEKLMKQEYGKNVRKYTQIGFLLVGILFLLIGVLKI